MKKIDKLCYLIKNSDNEYVKVYRDMYDSMLKVLVVNFLKSCENKYVTSDTIIENIDIIKHKSILRSIINSLRREGYPIVSKNLGYKYTTNKVEIFKCIASLKKRSDEMLLAANGLLKNID